jgi:hypothetical protein
MSISEDGEVTVVISGEEKGALGSDTSLFIVSDDIKNRDWYSIAQELYAQTNSGNLFVNPIRFSIDRNVSSESVSFSITFSNKQDNNVYVIDQTTITHDYEKSVNCIEASLSIRSNFGCHTSRWQNVQSYYQGLDFWQYINDRWREYGQTTSLNSRETSRSISENRYEGSITVSMTLCDNIGENCGCLQNLTYSLSFSPSIKQYSVSPTFGGRGCYYIEDLMASNRATFSVKGSVTPSPCCSIDQSLLQLQNRANQLANIYFAGSDKILETDSISEPSPRGELSFDFTWSADQSNIVPSDLL